MKKLLTILGATSIVVSTGANVTACGTNNGAGNKIITEGNIGIGDDSVCKILNVIANRHHSKELMATQGGLGFIMNSKKVTDQDIVDGINYMNGTGITLDDVDVEFDATKQLAKVKAKPDSKFFGENQFIINKQVRFEQFIKVKDLGDIYIPKSITFPPIKNGMKDSIPQLTLLMEFIGDRNRELEYITDAIAKLSLQGAFDDKLFKIQENQAMITLPSNTLITGTIEVSFNKKDENRPTIDELIKNLELDLSSDATDEEIIKEIYKNNSNTLGKYKESEILDAIEVSRDKKITVIQFKAGNNKFRGHDPASFPIINKALGKEDQFKKEDYQRKVTFNE